MTDEQAAPHAPGDAGAAPTGDGRRRRTSVWQLLCIGAAALLTTTVGVLALTAGEPPAAAEGGSGSGTGSGSDSGDGGSDPASGASTGDFAYPHCRVHVADTGDGYHVAVTLDNELKTVWLVVESDGDEQTVELPLELGMGQARLPVDTLPDKVVVWGTPDQQQFSSGCYWAPT